MVYGNLRLCVYSQYHLTKCCIFPHESTKLIRIVSFDRQTLTFWLFQDFKIKFRLRSDSDLKSRSVDNSGFSPPCFFPHKNVQKYLENAINNLSVNAELVI